MPNDLPVINSGLLRASSSAWRTPELLFRCLKGPALDALLELMPTFSGGVMQQTRQSLRMFDVLLFVLGEPPINSISFFNTARFEQLQLIYYGALSSKSFAELELTTRIDIARCFYNLLWHTSKLREVRMPSFVPKSTLLAINFLSLFEEQKLRPEALEEIRPYYLIDKYDVPYHTNLHPMRIVLGSEFTNKFHKTLAEHAYTKAKDTALRDFGNTFAAFIATKEGSISVESLNNGSFVALIMVEFIKFHFKKYTVIRGGAQSGTLPSLQKLWSRYIRYIELVFKAGLMAKPITPLPTGAPALTNVTEVRHQKTAVDKNGDTKITTDKLITALPLHLTDKQATELIFDQLKHDFEIVHDFVKDHLDSVFDGHKEGAILAIHAETTHQEDTSTKHFFTAHHSNALGNVVRYFKEFHGGYCDTNTTTNLVFPYRTKSDFTKSEIARLLGLPSRIDAQVFMAYLTLLDPQVTESALADARLFDRNGNRINAVNTDCGVVLSILKDRNKSNKWKEAIFKGDAAIALEKWIEITTPIRNYMRKNDIAGWRNLIVYLNAPLASPKVLKRSSNMNSTFRHFLRQHRDRLGRLADVVTFSRLRSTKGTLVFLETKDLAAMAKALGHSENTSLRHYMPDALWEYFSNRWIRIFQNLLIIDAVKNTPYLLDATDFSTMEELDNFLRIHTFSSLSENAHNSEAPANGDLLVNASNGIFSVLKSVWGAVECAMSESKKIDGLALYWYEFASTLGEHIESNRYKDYAIKNMWNNAKADPDRFAMVVLCD
jgi:hypothetical protein